MLKKLKSLFIIEEQGAGGKQKPVSESDDFVAPVSKKEYKNEASPVSANSAPDIPLGPGKVQDKFLNVLFGAMEKANLEGFDYLEFKQFLKSLDKVQMDEGTKYQSAYATAQTMGATLKVLRDSAQHYVNVLKTEGKKFDQAVENQKNKNLVSKTNEIKELSTVVSNKKKQIEAMRKEIEKHTLTIEKRKDEISSASAKVEKTERDFKASFELLVGQIKDDVRKIDTYLGKSKPAEKG